jgi:predicted MFS family arabinose efflux permease
LWAGETASQLGEQAAQVTLPLVAVVALHAGATELGALRAVEQAPILLLSLVAGAWVDRRRSRTVMVLADAGRAAALALVPVACAIGVPALAAVAFLIGTLGVFFDVAYQTSLVRLVAPEQLVPANGAMEGSRSAARICGPALGGTLASLLTAPVAALASAFFFALSFLSIRRIDRAELLPSPPARSPSLRRTRPAPTDGPQKRSLGPGPEVSGSAPPADRSHPRAGREAAGVLAGSRAGWGEGAASERRREAAKVLPGSRAGWGEEAASDRRPAAAGVLPGSRAGWGEEVASERRRAAAGAVRPRMWGQIREGLRFVAGHPVLRAVGLASAAYQFAFAALMTVYLLFLPRTLHLSGGAVGVVLAAMGPGALLGSVLAGRLPRRYGYGPVLAVSAALADAVLLCVPALHGSAAVTVPALVAANVLFGGLSQVVNVAVTAVRQAVTAPGMQGRVVATVNFAGLGLSPFGSLFGGFLAARYGLRTSLLVTVVALGLSPLIITVSPLARLGRELPPPHPGATDSRGDGGRA